MKYGVHHIDTDPAGVISLAGLPNRNTYRGPLGPTDEQAQVLVAQYRAYKATLELESGDHHGHDNDGHNDAASDGGVGTR